MTVWQYYRYSAVVTVNMNGLFAGHEREAVFASCDALSAKIGDRRRGGLPASGEDSGGPRRSSLLLSEPQEPQKALFLFEALNVCGFTTNRLSEFEDFFVGDREVDCGQRQIPASACKLFLHVVGQVLLRHVVP